MEWLRREESRIAGHSRVSVTQCCWVGGREKVSEMEGKERTQRSAVRIR